MEDLDNEKASGMSDEELFMDGVVEGDAEILFLDAYLHDIFAADVQLRS
ncbi:MAG: hypothetical protein J1D86_05575 [Alistipes sp.]|nr:hypothetical protein [Alistipes sp.]